MKENAIKEHYQRITSLGGKAAAKNMTPQQRKERAKKAAQARWEKKK